MMDLYQELDAAGLWEKEVELPRNAYLKVGGSADTNLYFVLEGCLRAYLIRDYEEYTIRFGYEGDFITALDSFISGMPSPFYLQALRKTRVRQISRDRYRSFMEEKPERLKIWNAILEQLVIQQLEREQDLLINSPQERYQRVLDRSPRLFQEVPHKHIASYLRMSPETLSRIKKS